MEWTKNPDGTYTRPDAPGWVVERYHVKSGNRARPFQRASRHSHKGWQATQNGHVRVQSARVKDVMASADRQIFVQRSS